jgi:hypothetical protein
MLTLLKFSRPAGAWITLGLATLIIFLFFHRNILEANRVSFAAGGDGLKSTFGSLYHIQYDSSYWMFEGMNYPYGESVFYTGNQTFLTNGIKLLKNRGLDLSGHTLGLLNLWMLFSFALCALLLYLVMAELGLPPWYAVAGSIVITFLSPQWYRMSGHYNLAYAWVIPLALYLMIRFYRKPGYLVSVLFGLFVLVISFKHAYFLAMVALPWTVFWLFLLMCSKSLYGKTAFLVPHLLIQMLIPVLIFGLFAASHDPAADRTAYPWGFFANTTRWVSVFLPLMKPYGRWIIVGPVKTLGYVGIVSTLVFLVSAGLLIGQIHPECPFPWRDTLPHHGTRVPVYLAAFDSELRGTLPAVPCHREVCDPFLLHHEHLYDLCAVALVHLPGQTLVRGFRNDCPCTGRL